MESTLTMLEDQLARVDSRSSRADALSAAQGRSRARLQAEERRLRKEREDERRRRAQDVADRSRLDLESWAGRPCLELSVQDGRIEAVDVPEWAEAIEPDGWIGRSLEELPSAVGAHLGDVVVGRPDDSSSVVFSDGVDDVKVFRSDSTVSATSSEALFRAIHVDLVGRVFLVTPDDLEPLLRARR